MTTEDMIEKLNSIANGEETQIESKFFQEVANRLRELEEYKFMYENLG